MNGDRRAPFVIRRAKESDERALADLEQDAFSGPWTRSMYAEALARPETLALCATAGEDAAGLILLRTAADEAEIMRLAVREKFRRMGLGSLLLGRGLVLAQERGAGTVFLEARETNRAALSFYLAHQFEIIGKRPRYYHDTGEAAVVMSKSLG